MVMLKPIPKLRHRHHAIIRRGLYQAHSVYVNVRPRFVITNARSGGLGDEDVDVAVFRFTLGIPGFDDRLVPRVVGAAGAAFLGVNHILVEGTEAQTRAESVGVMLAALLIIAPWIEERLLEMQPGKGRKAMEAVEGGVNCFHLSPSLNDENKKELAWASFALLKNTNCCSVMVRAANGAVLMARGAFSAAGVESGDVGKTQQLLSQDAAKLSSSTSDVANVLSGSKQQVYLNDRAAMMLAGLSDWKSIPAGVQSVVVQHIPGAANAALLVMSDGAGALSEKDRTWISAMAAKLAPACAA